MPGVVPATSGDALVITTAPSLAFYFALVFYVAASLLYLSAFVDAPRWVRGAARFALLFAFLAHGVDIGWRGVEHVHPGTSVREALGFMAWVMVGGYLIYTIKVQLRMLGAFVAPIAMIILAAARLSPSGEAMAGLGTLGRVHISLATIGVGIFALATALASFYLLEERNLKLKRFDGVLYKRGIALETLDVWSHRLILIGFPIFTVAMLLGVIWGAQRQESTWSRPETAIAWMTWASFAALIVARSTQGWRGRRAAFLTILGFVAALAVLAIYFVRRVVG
jgi:ABC-type uncharacterized transport system permease subunit